MENYLSINSMESLSTITNIDNAKHALININGFEVVVNKLKLKNMDKSNYEMIYPNIYSLDEMLDLIPSYIYYKNINYEFKLDKFGIDSFNVYYQNPYNKDDKQLEFYGTELIENLYYLYKKLLIDGIIKR